METAAGPLMAYGDIDADEVRRRLPEIVALSTLPATWLGAEPLHIAESLASTLYEAIEAEFVYVSLTAAREAAPVTALQTGNDEENQTLAERLGPVICEWAQEHDPQEILTLTPDLHPHSVFVTLRPIGRKGELGVVAAAVADLARLTAAEHLILNVAASQAATAVETMRLASALRQSEDNNRRIHSELSTRIRELETAASELRNSRRAALNVMEDAVQAREALSQRTAQFETLLNASPLGVYLIDADFRIREVNPTALPTFGDIPELVGRDFAEVLRVLWPPGYANELIALFRRTLSTGEPYRNHESIEFRRDRGVKEYYDWQIHRIPLPDGRFGVVCYFQDISSQVQARLAIAEAAERLRFMAESMPQKIYTARPGGDIDYMNRRWTEFTGLPFERLQERGWTEIIHPDDLEQHLRLWEDSLHTGEPFQCVHRFRRADGIFRWHLTRAQPMRDADGNVSMWIGSNTEIHEQKMVEAELRIANQDLEQFAYSASHDLQEPLRSVKIYSELLMRRYAHKLDGQAAEFLSYVRDGATRMELLIRDLLAYTQVTKLEAPEDVGDAGAAYREALANLHEAIVESGAQITADELPVLRVNGTHLRQLFQNLIGNAIKYRNSDRPPVIHVRAEKREGSHVLSVTDNGLGIEAEYRDRIFGLFKRLHTAPQYSGTGIGLAICQRIVERYQGRIWVESQLGVGSTFFFTFPA